MRDGRTRRISGPMDTVATASFLDRHEVALVVLSGDGAGNEVAVERSPTTLGRGPGVDLAFDDPAMSRQHVAFETTGTHLRVRDLGSTNGIRVNGHPAVAADLKHGDRIDIGGHQFQLVVAPRRKAERAYVLPDD